jgi:energy-converting hydrogenase Eha subunit C
MNPIYLGRGLLVGGLIATLLAGAPALLLQVIPALDGGFITVLAVMLLLTVVPLAVMIASAGAILLLWGLVQRRG